MSAASLARAEGAAPNRALITVCLMLATIVVALDLSLAPIALPHMQGTLSASDDQITWVMTSYYVALAISTACSGWLAGRIGRKKLYIIALVGFTLASMLSGTGSSLDEMVVYRSLQGAFAAPIIPLSQAMILDTYPVEKHGPALSAWAMGVMVAPVFGPVVGGWLTEAAGWRWVFYVNVPFGIVAVLGALTFFVETPKDKERKFDWFGFCALALALACVQLVLDRGESLGWFGSMEIVLECGIGALAFYIFLAHSATTSNPFVSPAILKDRNMALGLFFAFMLGLIVLTTNVIMPLFLQNLRGYPVETAGLVMGPRGIGTLASMLIAGRLVNRLDPRGLMVFGFSVVAVSSYMMAGFTPDVTVGDFVVVTVMNGFGIGFVWVPLTVMTFATLPGQYRTEGATVWALIRNYGSSVGIAALMSILSRSGRQTHAGLTEVITPYNEVLTGADMPSQWSIWSTNGLAMLEAEISRQSWMVGFNNDFRALFIGTVLMIPFVLLLHRPQHQIGQKSAAE